jgi:hypothetical protein
MSGLRGRLIALRRSLGPRRTAALAAAVLAAVTVAAVALTGGRSNNSHPGLAVQAARPSTTNTVASPIPGQRGAAKRHRTSARKRASVASHAKAAAKHARARSPRPANHRAAAKNNRHTNPSTSTTTTTTSPPSTGPVSVTFVVHGGGNASLVACGDMHHFRTYGVGASLSFSGAVQPVPSGQWKIKLHIKVCQGGAYQDFAKIDAHENHSTGAFHGTFSAPPSGLYEVRAVLYLGATESTESDKVHLESR